MKVFGVVYLILNKLNGKMYVGQTTKPIEKRFNEHANCKKTVIGKAIQKYGRENFRCEVLKRCHSKKDLDAWEKFFIAALKTKSPIGYNFTDGGEGSVGCIITEETRKKRSAALKGRSKSPEHCAKLSAAKMGKQLTAETCAKMSAAQSGERSHNYGKQLPAKTCTKISAANRGNSSFKNLLREIDVHQLSYYKLAALMRVAYTTISAKMLGRLNFTAKDKVKLEKIFGKPAEYLLEREPCAKVAKAQCNNSPYKNLLKELEAPQISYRNLAELLGLSHTSVARKMRGERNFTERDKVKLEKIFGKTAEYLLEREEN